MAFTGNSDLYSIIANSGWKVFLSLAILENHEKNWT